MNRKLSILVFGLLVAGVSRAQNADINANPTSGCAPLIVVFKDATTGGTATSWSWSFPGGLPAASSSQSQNVTFNNPGTYNVTLTINGGGSPNLTKTIAITVWTPPSANFSVAGDSVGCFPFPVQFLSGAMPGSAPIVTYNWGFGDGNVSPLKNPTHTYLTQAQFPVTLQVVDQNGCADVSSITHYIIITGGVTASFSTIASSGCSLPVTIQLNNTSSGVPGNPNNYTWTFGDGSPSSNLISPPHTYFASGTYPIILVAQSPAGCTASDTVRTQITSGNVSSSFKSPDSVCVNSPINFQNTSTPAPTVSNWIFGDGTSSDSINAVKTYSSANVYTVSLTNTFGACIDSISKQITVLNPAIPAFTASSTVSCDSLFTVNFTDQSTGASSWLWTFGDGGTSNARNPTHTYKGYGVYTVSLKVSNASACGGTLTKNLYIQNQKPVIAISNLNSQGCAPFSFSPVLTATVVDGINTYNWDFGDGTGSTSASPPAHAYPVAGVYIVKLTITTNGGCSVSTTDTVRVGTIKPVVSFTESPNTACTNGPISFTDNSTNNPNAWLWIFGDGSTSTTQSPTHRYQVPGTFTVTLIAYNNGCNDSAKANVKVNLPLANFTYSFSCLSNTMVFSFHDTSIGADTWHWDFGDKTFFDGQSPPTHTYPAIDTTYTATLTVTNFTTGCSNSSSQFVSVVRGTASYVSSAYNICKNSPIVITVFNVKNSVIYSYTYDFGDGTVITTLAGTLPHTYTITGPHQVKIILTEFNGCLDTLVDPKVIIHVGGPTADFTTPKNLGCTGFAATFTDKSIPDGVNPIKQWIWDFGDSTIQTFTSPPFIHNYTKQGIFTVKLKVIDASGCADSITKTSLITIALPKANFTTLDSLSCPGSPIQFVNNSQGYGLRYTWYFGTTDTSNKANPTYIYPFGNFKASLKVTDQFGCTDSVGNYNIRIDTPFAAFTMIDTFSSCPPLVADFRFTGSYYKTLTWLFGDGGQSIYPTNPNGLDPIYLYALPGIYYAKLIVMSHGGCTDTAISSPIHILGPVGALNFTPDIGCHIVNVNFKLTTSNNVTNFLWLFNPTQSDSTKVDSTSFTYDSIGIFHPSVVLRDSTGCNVLIQSADSVVVLGSRPRIWANTKIVCGSGNVQFKDSSFTTGTISNWYWDFGDGKHDSTNQNPTHFYASPGIYSVKLVVVTQSNCQDSITMNNLIKVVASPIIAITGDQEKCVPASMNFQGVILQADTSAFRWHWDFGNGKTDSVQNPAAQFYPMAGMDSVKLTATNSSNCATTVFKLIQIDPIAVTSAGPDTAICLGQSAFLHGSSSISPAAYTWLPPTNGTLSCFNCPSPVATPVTTTSYYLQTTNVFGCGTIDTVVVTVVQPLAMNVAPLNDSVCIGQSVQLIASGEILYTWSPATGLNNTLISNPIATPDTTTIYQVTGSDSLHCFSNTQSVKVNVFKYPTINLGPGTVTIPVGTTYQISGIGSADIDSINWSPTIGLSCANCLSPLASPTTTTTFVVKVENNGGCITADSIRIIVTCDGKNIFVPNTFSPNGDGMNDWFFVQGTGLTTIQSLRIFNRWGQLVFEKINFAPNVENEGWNGNFNGKKAPVDVYVYTIEVVCENSQVVAYHGNVALIR